MAQARFGESSDKRLGEQTILSVKFETTMPGDLTEQAFLNRISKEPSNDEHDELVLPSSSRCSSNDIDGLIDHVYHTIDITPLDYFEKRCIISPREGEVNQINHIMLNRLPGEACHFGSIVGACDPYNQLRRGTAFLILKRGCPVVLMRNGCRGIVTELGGPFLSVRMFSGRVVTVQRTPLASYNGMVLLQFPVKLAFAMTIEEARGHTFSTLGIDLRYPSLSRGQLLLALSTGVDPTGVKFIGGTNTDLSQTERVHSCNDR